MGDTGAAATLPPLVPAAIAYPPFGYPAVATAAALIELSTVAAAPVPVPVPVPVPPPGPHTFTELEKMCADDPPLPRPYALTNAEHRIKAMVRAAAPAPAARRRPPPPTEALADDAERSQVPRWVLELKRVDFNVWDRMWYFREDIVQDQEERKALTLVRRRALARVAARKKRRDARPPPPKQLRRRS